MSHKKAIKFGTDGWRGVISEDFTFENVRVVAQAISDWINKKSTTKERAKKVVVGFDTRFLSEEYAKTAASVLAANGIFVSLSNKPTPTPTVSFSVAKNGFDAGVMITASHNPAQFNGIKIKTSTGAAAPTSVTETVEKFLFKNRVKVLDLNKAIISKRIKVQDLTRDYVDFLRGYINLKKIKKHKFKVLVDAMHGSGDNFIAEILKGTSIRLSVMRSEINPSFEGKRPEPTVENLEGILSIMKKEPFDLGLVLDGDADRIAAVEPGGRFIHPQKILGLLALHLNQDRHLNGGIVKTIAGTNLIDNIARKLRLKLYETPVGFKYISDLMVKQDILVGGEEAGGMGFKNYIPERDGILAGLLLLEMMVYRKKSMEKIVKEVENEFGRYYYQRADLKTHHKNLNLDRIKKIKQILGKKVIRLKDFDGIKLICEDESWLMFRASGTESLVRVYAEAKSKNKSEALINFGKKIIKSV
ncbi:MAG: phosphoglucomutase/phosphomannomutase family protein [Candidatus Omnitrophota bacterium]|nr:phosphoglucomutase/phosphomannomutase family protein [Candidatus Omnitrophota bacterium]